MYASFRYDVHAGNAPDAYGAPEVLDGTSRILVITAWDNPMLLSFSYDGVTFGDDMEVDSEHPPMEIPYACKQFKVKNKTAGNIARFQVVSFW